ncbi:MAG: hypothetical protein M3Z37_09170 [Candidatus Eremiobacteraeota bacterium]|nr:hypothetical protein [Candidatus Eremiobacteraeota bacterium]
MNTIMKWIFGIALVAASASILVPALLHYRAEIRSNGRLESLHESASF